MEITSQQVPAHGIKFEIKGGGGRVIGRTYLYVMTNDLHDQPFGFMEDVWVDPDHRGQGHATTLVREAIQKARAIGCYKLICTSRHSKPGVQAWYERLGFTNHGVELRMNFPTSG